MAVLYNEIDKYAAQWIRNLVEAGHVAPGEVEEAPLQTLDPECLKDVTQFHTCAGIATWSRALRDAGWPDDAEVFTASLPCQPFSTAGRKKGFDDERHLWPAYFKLVRERRPPVIYFEQVASPDGRAWLDAVQSDLERAGYAVGTFDLPASGVGAPHLRQRLYIVAIADGERLERVRVQLRTGRSRSPLLQVGGRGEVGGVADAERDGRGTRWLDEPRGRETIEPDRLGDPGSVGNAGSERSGWYAGTVPRAQAEGASEGFEYWYLPDELVPAGAVSGFWADDVRFVICQDGKARPVSRGIQPLAHGTPKGVVRNRAKRLKGYGNGICLPLATTFIEAVIDVLVDGAT